MMRKFRSEKRIRRFSPKLIATVAQRMVAEQMQKVKKITKVSG